ncbi:Fur family ferric uptake transcriptional regulator [Rhizobium sp. SORGH_AS 787]|uniref:Ferric uptake regulation protein n=1 Tax=Agrobacterium larrymoorei TaxID=160699 RepID=A0AAJ2ETD3_9HYPH|nr:Fur family ferric uptake transcriptional regulator [Agrobacterium larrymoorei]MDQ1197380.1 Fur family ferric uptake transcriptional regulator [Rhizobium sp. SORGH_AS_0787]MDR6103991.1 Fur family ferric uptake transcriptional regulator [Agrobacterium larrymoorei]
MPPLWWTNDASEGLIIVVDLSKTLEDICAERGMRMTDQRRVIARVLQESEDHPDVEELYRRSSAVDPKISISTVYRTVKLFEDAGIIERHDFRDGRSRYETVPEEHHDHLIDLKNGVVIEFRSAEIEALQEKIAREHGFKLVDHRLELYGVPLKPEER